MADAKRDNNYVTTLLAVSNADGTTPVVLWADPVTHRLLTSATGGTGDVVGPASATDNAIVRFDLATGKLIQDSVVTIADTTGVIAGTKGIILSGSTSGTTSFVAAAVAGTTTVTLPAATGTVALGTGTTNEIAYWSGANTLGALAVATYPSLTELSYVKGVTSAIQTQLNNKITNDSGAVGFADLDAKTVYPAHLGWTAASTSSVSAIPTSNGSVVTLTVQKSGGGDFDIIFSTGFVTVDATPALTVTLTAGSDAAPQINYAYIRAAAPTVVTVSTTGFPDAEEFHPIGTYLVPSAATTQTYGVYKAHNWTDHVKSTNNNGHVAHINEWIRRQPATWVSGCLCTPTLTTAPTPDTLTIAVSSGVVLQLHDHTYPAFDSAVAGTTSANTFFVANHPTDYTPAKDFASSALLQDSAGNAVTGNNKRISWVVWGVVSQEDADCKIMVNLPSGFYTSDAAAVADDSKYANYNIPSDYIGTGFLIAKLTYHVSNSTPGSYALTLVENLDLRGTFPSIVAGGSSASSTTFPDNVFQVYDEADSTKIIAFQASGITTGNTRTFTAPDTSGTLPVGTGTANEIPYWSGANTLGTLAVATYPSLTELSYVKGVTSAIQTQLGGLVSKSTYDAHTVLYATTDNTPVALTVGEQTLVGRATGGNIAAIAIDSDLSSVSANDDTVPSAKATKAMGDLKLPLAGGTMSGNITLGENTSLDLDPAGSADGKYTGLAITGTAGATLAFGDLITLDKDDSRWEKVDISVAAAATGDARGIIGICVLAAANDGDATKILLNGTIRADANFPTLTIGAAVYASTTGDIVVTQPTTTDHVIRLVGYALTADEIYFLPENDWITSI